MEKSSIEWTDATINFWWGCTKVSPGCANCYAESLSHRFGDDIWGKGKPRRKIKGAVALAMKLEKKSKAQVEAGGRRIRVFCSSMSDWLDPEVPIEWLAEMLDTVRKTPHLDWLLLTKRPELFRERLDAVRAHFHRFKGGLSLETAFFATFLDNMRKGWDGVTYSAPEVGRENYWIGTSAEDQTRADERIPALLNIPAKVRFLSCEPLLGEVDLTHVRKGDNQWFPMQHIHWVIVGCESGVNRRPMKMQWAMDLRDQCYAAGVSFFMKQMSDTTKKVTGDIERFPACLQVREFPQGGAL